MNLFKFAPLLKIEEQSDGTLMVHSLITEQMPDLDKEVCDYATTKAFYEKRAKENLAKTSVVGMTPSVMPIREMHQLKAIGAGRDIEYSDAALKISAWTHIVEPTAVAKFKAGVLVGFSQGGDYVKKWADPDFPGCTRYTADPAEWSAVDSPCLPSALVDAMKGKTVTLQKAGGVTEQVPLQILPVDQARLVKLEREVDELRKQALAKREFTDAERKKLADEGKALPDGSYPIENVSDLENAIQAYGRNPTAEVKAHIVRRAKALDATNKLPADWTTKSEKAAVARACAKLALSKGLYEVGYFAQILESLNYLCLQSEWERDVEDDGSKVPDELRESWLALLESFKAMAEEEADEMAAAGGKGEKGMKITDQAGLTKAAKTIGEHLAKHMEMHKALHEKIEGALAKDHPIMKAHAAMMDHCEKCMKAAKDAGAGEEPEGDGEAEKAAKAATEAALAKAAADNPLVATLVAQNTELTKANAALSTKFDEVLKKLEKIPAAGGPHSGTVDLSKVNASDPFAALLEAPVTH